MLERYDENKFRIVLIYRILKIRILHEIKNNTIRNRLNIVLADFIT